MQIKLSDRDSQHPFNLRRWTELLADPVLAKIPNRIETDRHGQIVMRPLLPPLHGGDWEKPGAETAATSDLGPLWFSQTLPPQFTSSTSCSSRSTRLSGGACTCTATAVSPRCTTCSGSYSIGATLLSRLGKALRQLGQEKETSVNPAARWFVFRIQLQNGCLRRHGPMNMESRKYE